LPAIIANKYGKGCAVCFNSVLGVGPGSSRVFTDAIAPAGLGRNFSLTNGKAAITGYECFEYGKGGIKYLSVMRDFSPGHEKTRNSFFGSNFRLTSDQNEIVNVRFAGKNHIYDVRTGRYFGNVEEVMLETHPDECKFLAMMPYKVRCVQISGTDPVYEQGKDVKFQVSIVAEFGTAGDHAIRIEVYNPAKKLVRHYSKNAWAAAGVYRGTIPLALNESTGVWELRVTDVISKTASRQVFEVKFGRASDVN
jgi:hypothetical protein